MSWSWFARFCLALAARRYARLLGPRLRHDYGGGGEYTAAQIRLAAKKSRLPRRYIKLGFAAFMTEDAFRAVSEECDWPDYAALRALYLDWVPVSSYSKPDAPDAADFLWVSRRDGWLR